MELQVLQRLRKSSLCLTLLAVYWSPMLYSGIVITVGKEILDLVAQKGWSWGDFFFGMVGALAKRTTVFPEIEKSTPTDLGGGCLVPSCCSLSARCNHHFPTKNGTPQWAPIFRLRQVHRQNQWSALP